MVEVILKDNHSDCFDLISYPDGQHSIKLKFEKLNIKQITHIKCRIKNFSELEVLGCLVAALNKNDYAYSICFVYLFGVRSDRSFNPGEPNYFRDVLAPIINSYNARHVEIFWPFVPLPIMNGYINNNLASYRNIFFTGSGCRLTEFKEVLRENEIEIAGDESAINCLTSIYQFKKNRSANGIEVSLDEIPADTKIITIVDDLCDGGATFIAEAKYLKENYPDIKLELFIYHGLFTKGLDELLEYFDVIRCTNSYQDIEHPRVNQIEVI